MKATFTFTAKTEPECKTFLQIREETTVYSIDEYAAKHPDDMDDAVKMCSILYRDVEYAYQKVVDDNVAFSESLAFFDFRKPIFVIDPSIRGSIYFATKATECLQFARYFAMNSALLLDIDYNLHWEQGYVPQYLIRCLNFGTATTWYANCFDHILQIVFWGMKLYTAVTDRHRNAYDDTWDAKKTVALCTYKFVVGELRARGLEDVRKLLTSCSTQIEEVRKWSNYIKHKGGIDYKYLEPESPFGLYYVPVSEATQDSNPEETGSMPKLPDEQFAIKDFKSPIEVDIDEKLSELQKVHIALHKCLSEIVGAVDFDAHAVQIRTE